MTASASASAAAMFCGRARSPTTALAHSRGTALGRRRRTRKRYPSFGSSRSRNCPMNPVAPVSATRGFFAEAAELTSISPECAVGASIDRAHRESAALLREGRPHGGLQLHGYCVFFAAEGVAGLDHSG